MAADTTVALRGYERMATMARGSRKIVHVMLLRGPSVATKLPAAVAFVFNRHPRMRALQLADEFARASIAPPVTLQDVTDRRLLRVRDASTDDDASGWQAYVDRECEEPFDRFTQFPFFLSVWTNAAANETRLLLFSDHYMSDGMSGLIVLNDILERVADVAPAPDQHEMPSLPLPLRPSLYSLWIETQPTLKRLASEWLVWLVGPRLFKSDVDQFQLLLPARSDQQRFDVPVRANRTYSMFADGCPNNAKRALARCKEQGATFTGALVAAVTLAQYHAAKKHATAPVDATSFKFSLTIDCNMRSRLPEPLAEAPVGYYVASKALDRLAKEGVNLPTARFWDVARTASRDIQNMLQADFSLSLSSVFQDLFLHSEMGSHGLGFAVPSALTSDAAISNIGRYPFKRSFPVDGGGDGAALTVETLHFYNSMPWLAPAAGVYVSATDRFGYALAHKLADEAARALFPAVVAFCEHIGDVDAEQTMQSVAENVALTM